MKCHVADIMQPGGPNAQRPTVPVLRKSSPPSAPLRHSRVGGNLAALPPPLVFSPICGKVSGPLPRLRGRPRERVCASAGPPAPSSPSAALNWFVVSLSNPGTGLEYGGAQRGDAPLPGAWGCPPQHDGRVGGKVTPRRRIGLRKGLVCGGESERGAATSAPSPIPDQPLPWTPTGEDLSPSRSPPYQGGARGGSTGGPPPPPPALAKTGGPKFLEFLNS